MLSPLMVDIYVLMLASFIGFELIRKVPPTLHTPLMSGTNAITGISLVGALVAAGHEGSMIAKFLGFLAVTSAAINVVGGFMLTDRMLKMFRKKDK
jgi:NAD(P) transhydrogenase subunit alpha